MPGEGMYVVGRNFYARFLPEARAVAGSRAAELVDGKIASNEAHAWLNRPDRASPILGFGPAED